MQDLDIKRITDVRKHNGELKTFFVINSNAQ